MSHDTALEKKLYGIISFYDENLSYGYIQIIDKEQYNLINNSINDHKLIIEELKKSSMDTYKVYYFDKINITNLDSSNKVLVGAIVEFNPIYDKLKASASNISINHIIEGILNNKDWNIYSSSYVKCNNCNKIMVPTIKSELNQPLYAICPLCGGVYKDLRTDKYKVRQKSLPILFIIFIIISIISFILN